jgi:hypothetical protein
METAEMGIVGGRVCARNADMFAGNTVASNEDGSRIIVDEKTRCVTIWFVWLGPIEIGDPLVSLAGARSIARARNSIASLR